MRSTLYAIRAHRPTPAVARLRRTLINSAPRADVVIVADEMHGAPRQAWPDDYDLVAITDDVLASAGLRTDIADAGWRCGDYAYYALAAQRSFDRALLIEPDVAFPQLDVARWLSDLEESDADLAAADIMPASEWLWAHQLRVRGVDAPWRCFFPVTRLSQRAIDAARELRVRTQWIDDRGFGHPNDEGVVASSTAARDLEILDVRGTWPARFEHFRHRPYLRESTVPSLVQKPGVSHPVLDDAEYLSRLRRGLLGAARTDILASLHNRRATTAQTIERLGDFALLTTAQRDIHAQIFGPPEESARYDDEFRNRVHARLPIDLRLLTSLSGILVETAAALTGHSRSPRKSSP